MTTAPASRVGSQSGHAPPASERYAIAPSASLEEAAAIVAALERFIRATAIPARSPGEGPDGWQRAARLEGVERWPLQEAREAWIDP